MGGGGGGRGADGRVADGRVADGVAELQLRVLRALVEVVVSHTTAHRLLGHSERPPACLDALSSLAGCLASEHTQTLATSLELVCLVCLTRAGRAAFAANEASLASLVELLTHEDDKVRSNVLNALTSLSADAAAAAELSRTSAAQVALDLIECERLDNPSAPTAASDAPGASEMQRAMRVLTNLVHHDANLLSMCIDHPAVADLEAWKSGEAYGGTPPAGAAPTAESSAQRRLMGATSAGTAGCTDLLGRGTSGANLLGGGNATPGLMARLRK